MSEDGPQPTENAATVARVCGQVAVGLIALAWPPAALAAPFVDELVSRQVRRPQALLVESLTKKGVDRLDEQQAATLYPMGVRYFSAAQSGEYEHNLRVLAACIAGELVKEVPDPARINRTARQIEGLSLDNLRTLALIDSFVAEAEALPQDDYLKKIICSRNIYESKTNSQDLSQQTIWSSLAELSSRSLIIEEGASRWDKQENFYLLAPSFHELIAAAKQALQEEAESVTAKGGSA